jgi:phospholipase/carboxylesterase
VTGFAEPVVAWAGQDDPERPLVVLLHGRGADETTILGLADHLPDGPSYAAVRAPITEGGGFAWFANRGIGRPVADSLSQTMAWFRGWLDDVAPNGRPVVLVGFSGGAAFAGGLLLSDPQRFAGAAILYGTLPFDAGIPVLPARLQGVPVFVAQGDADTVIPRELLDRTWAYLLGDSGARASARRDPGGHAITADTVAELGGWIAERLRFLSLREPNPPRRVITSRADVATDAPGRYAKQLVAHLGRKLEFTTTGATSTTTIGEATGEVVVGDGVLTLVASGNDEDAVARVEHVLGSHLERFGQRNELAVTWTRG